MKSCAVVAIAIACLLSCIGAASADDKEEAEKHFNTGFSLMEKRDFKAAAVELELSVKLYANKNNLYNLANCYRGAKRFGEALATFERVLKDLDDKLDDEMRQDIKKQISMLKGFVSRLLVRTTPTGALIKVDRIEVGTSPLPEPLVLGPGDHEIEVSLAGYDPGNRRVTLVPGTDKSITIALQLTKASLTMTANEAGAAVSLNGKQIGFTPISVSIALEAGNHRVSMKKDGFEPTEQEITLAAGEVKSLHFDLTPIPPPKATPVAAQPPPAPQSEKQEKKGGRSPIFWAGLAGTAVFACVSGAMWGVTVAKRNDRESKVQEINSKMDEWDFSRPEDDQEERGLREDANKLGRQMLTLNKVAVGMTIVTGAFAALTVVGLVMKRKNKESSAPEVSAAPGGLQVSF